MSNGPSSPVDFSQELSAFLASAVSNGTWADVIDALKADAVPAQATDITAVAGQLWANVQDDLFKATWERLFSARKLWAFADSPARDGTGSDQGLAVGDVCTLTDTPGSFFVCDTVAASSSTWLPAGGSGGGLQPLVVQEAVWSAGLGTQVEAVPVGAALYAIPGGGQSIRPFQAQLPDSASVGERVGFQYFGVPDLQPIEITTPSGTLNVEGPASTGTLVTLFDATGELFDTAYLVWEYQIVLGSPIWKLVNYHQEPKAAGGGVGDWASVLAAGNGSGGTDAALTSEDRVEWNPPVTGGPGPPTPSIRGWKTARRASLPGSLSGDVLIGGPLVLASGPGRELLDLNNLLTLRIQGARRTLDNPVPGAVIQDYAVIERVYQPTSAGGLSIAQTITYQNPGDWLEVANNGGAISLQVADGSSPADVYAVVEVVASPGRTFA